MNATITLAIKDPQGRLSHIRIFSAPLEERLVGEDDGGGLGVMRVFPDPDGDTLWHTFVGPHGDCRNEGVYIKDPEGSLRETNLIVLRTMTEGGQEGARRFGER